MEDEPNEIVSEIKGIGPPSGSVGRDGRVSVGATIAKCAPAVFEISRDRIDGEYICNLIN
jgi:hypothetical protein